MTAGEVSPATGSVLLTDSLGCISRNVRSQLRRNDPAISVAVIDGPYDATVIADVLARRPIDLADTSWCEQVGRACGHGTFVMGLIGAGYDATIPGLSPDCQLLHYPLFVDEYSSSSASIEKLALGIQVAAAVGARLINLSLAILGDDPQSDRALEDALDYAQSKDCVVLVAAGNQGKMVGGQLLSHPVTIPVVAINAAGTLLPECNFGPMICQRGIAALGENILGYAPGGGKAIMSGTSVATAVATATLATIWAEQPMATGAAIRAAVQQLRPRERLIPPGIRRNTILAAIRPTRTNAKGRYSVRPDNSGYASLQGEAVMREDAKLPTSFPFAADQSSPSRPIVALAQSPGKCACGASDGACTCADKPNNLSGFVYAIGTVEASYPNVAIEHEMQIMADHFGVKAEADINAATKPTEDRIWQYEVLSKDRRRTRYIARQLRWRLMIEDMPAFVLVPRDSNDLDDFIDCLNRPRYIQSSERKGKKGAKARSTYEAPLYGLTQDLDVVVGVKGPQTVEGTEVFVDQIFTLSPQHLTPAGLSFYGQLADNYGLTDGDRAYNFLLARYAISHENLVEVHKDFGLAAVPVISSRLSGGIGRVVRVIYTFRGTKIPIERKFFVRVDVTHEFPTVISPWQEYLERGETS